MSKRESEGCKEVSSSSVTNTQAHQYAGKLQGFCNDDIYWRGEINSEFTLTAP
jgi:hypothetical protein